jgi:hypothetical protein
MTIYCIRTRRPGEHSWQFVCRGEAVTDRRRLALTWQGKELADRWVPHYARVLPGREFRVSPVTAYAV